MEFEQYLKINAKKVEKELDKILLSFLKETTLKNKKLAPFAKEFIKSCKGGKKVRGVLCMLGYELVGGKGSEVFKIAAAWEILHTALLIHDDIMDQSPKRRGMPSLYKVLGENEALCLGDIGLYLPIKIITDANFSDQIKLRVLSRFSRIVIDTGWGQLLDVKGKDKKFVDLYKTAKYTIAGPLQVGVTLGGGDDKLIKKLGEFGEDLGIAFQIKDDILDSEGGDLQQALEYINKAKRLIPTIAKDKKMSSLLEKMADYIIERSK